MSVNQQRVFASSVTPTNITVPGGSASNTFRYTFPPNSGPGGITPTIDPMQVTITGNVANRIQITFTVAGKTLILSHAVGESEPQVTRNDGLTYQFLRQADNTFFFRIIVDSTVTLPEPNSTVNTQAFYVFRLIHPNNNPGGGVTLVPAIKPPGESGRFGDYTTMEYDVGGACVLL